MNLNEIQNDVSQYRERKWTHRASVNRRSYLDIRGYESGRMIKGEMAPTTRRHRLMSGMHVQ